LKKNASGLTGGKLSTSDRKGDVHKYVGRREMLNVGVLELTSLGRGFYANDSPEKRGVEKPGQREKKGGSPRKEIL